LAVLFPFKNFIFFCRFFAFFLPFFLNVHYFAKHYLFFLVGSETL